jgi:hypothetical protein
MQFSKLGIIDLYNLNQRIKKHWSAGVLEYWSKGVLKSPPYSDYHTVIAYRLTGKIFIGLILRELFL